MAIKALVPGTEAPAHESAPRRGRVYAHPNVVGVSDGQVFFRDGTSGLFLPDGVTCEVPSMMSPSTRVRIPSLDAAHYDCVVEELLLNFATSYHHWLFMRALFVPEACEPALEYLFRRQVFELLGNGVERQPTDYFGIAKTSVSPARATLSSLPAFRVEEKSDGVHLHFGQLQKDASADSGWTLRNVTAGDVETGPSTYFRCER